MVLMPRKRQHYSVRYVLKNKIITLQIYKLKRIEIEEPGCWCSALFSMIYGKGSLIQILQDHSI